MVCEVVILGKAASTVSVGRRSNMAMLSTMQSLNTRAFGRAMPVVRPAQVSRPLSRTPLRIQNLRVNNVEIPNSKKVEISLQYIYGIGSTTAKAILRDTGVENKRCYELNEEEINKIREEVGKYTTEADLRRIVAQNIKRLKDIGCYRGRRHIMGLPVRGQRTKTNARTRKGKPKTVAGKKK